MFKGKTKLPKIKKPNHRRNQSKLNKEFDHNLTVINIGMPQNIESFNNKDQL